MKRSTSWVVNDAGKTPVPRVAARTLRKRLEATWSELSAACRPRHDPERVHRLRVATRRALAALAAFRDIGPGKQRAWFEKWLRRIRRAAGDTRDLDVLTGRLQREPAADEGQTHSAQAARARQRLVEMLANRRDVSREPMRQVRERLVAADWPGRVERFLEAVAAATTRTSFADYGRQRMRPLLERFFDHAKRTSQTASDIHRLRIEGKKLRYAIEIFAVVFPPTQRAACSAVLEELQNSLGEFTDHAAASDRLRRLSKEKNMAPDRVALVALRKAEDIRAAEARRAFAKWWKPSRRRQLRRRIERTLQRKTA